MIKRLLFSLPILFSIFNLSFATPPESLTAAKKAVISYYQSANYENDVKAVMNDAEKYLQTRIISNRQLAHPKKLAIVFDIDDTALTNFYHIKQRDFSDNQKFIERDYKKADAPAIKPVLSLYQKAIDAKVAIFFITFRPKKFESYTVKNLKRTGYKHWSGLYMPNNKDLKKGAIVFKTRIRKKLTKKNYDIVLNVGDQYSDLKGGYAEHTYKLPNPLYG